MTNMCNSQPFPVRSLADGVEFAAAPSIVQGSSKPRAAAAALACRRPSRAGPRRCRRLRLARGHFRRRRPRPPARAPPRTGGSVIGRFHPALRVSNGFRSQRGSIRSKRRCNRTYPTAQKQGFPSRPTRKRDLHVHHTLSLTRRTALRLRQSQAVRRLVERVLLQKDPFDRSSGIGSSHSQLVASHIQRQYLKRIGAVAVPHE